MTEHEPLTDIELEAMLARRASRTRADGLHASIMAEVGTTRQRHAPWFSWHAWPIARQPELRLLWQLAILGLLLALAAGMAAVGARLLEHTPAFPERPSALVPWGLETVSDATLYLQTVVDGEGVLWASGPGRLTRYDPATGAGRTWTIDDDLRFGATPVSTWIAPARAGGVWVIGAHTLNRFDGSDFREEMDVGADIGVATEAPDGTLWVATTDGDVVVHLDGASVTKIKVPRPASGASITAVAVDGAGHVWCGWTHYPLPPGGGWVSRYDGATWQTFDGTDAPALRSAVRSITPLADGSVWVGGDQSFASSADPRSQDAIPGGLAYFDGTTWTDVGIEEPHMQNVTSVATGPDGSIWVTAGPEATTSGAFVPPAVLHLERGNWTRYGPADGLPGADETTYASAWMVPTDGRIFVGTGAGIYELADSRWERVWPTTQPAGPASPQQVIAVSHDEVWAVDVQTVQSEWSVQPEWRVWHYAHGTWSRVPTPSPVRYVRHMLRTPDGSVWITTEFGAYVLQGATWTQMSMGQAWGLGADRQGVVWVTSGSATWEAHSYALDGATWTERERTPPTALIVEPSQVAVAPEGTLWVGSFGWGLDPAGLVRFVDGTWEKVDVRDDMSFEVTGLLATPSGDLWVTGIDNVMTTTAEGMQAWSGFWAAHFDGSDWQMYGPAEGLQESDTVPFFPFAGPDGTVYVATAHGIAHFDGASWKTLLPEVSFQVVSVAPDGTIWAIGPSGVERLTDVVAR